MPDVNLLKDTEKYPDGRPRPPVPPQPELSSPDIPPATGFGAVFKSLFNRGPRALPTSPSQAAHPNTSSMSASRSRVGERILSETKRSAPSVIPLPEEDEDASYNVNLLSEDLVSTINPKKRGVWLGLIALGAIVVVGLAYGGLLIYQSKIKAKITTTEDALTAANDQIPTLSTDQLAAASTVQKIAAIRGLVDRHIRWTKFFALLEKYTLPSVTYGPSFGGDLNGALTLTGKTNSYEEVAKQYLVFQQLVREKKFISNFSITGATSSVSKEGTQTITFVVNMTLIPADFTLTESEVSALVSPTTPTTPTTLAPETNTNSSLSTQP